MLGKPLIARNTGLFVEAGRLRYWRDIDRDATLLVPLGVILETGNHVAQLGDDNKRRYHAKRFRGQTGKALAGEAPWSLAPLPDCKQLNS